MKVWLLLIFAVHNVDAISIGLISKASLVFPAASYSSLVAGQEQECVCTMINSSNVFALNYFDNNTCQFFSNVSLSNTSFSWLINQQSLFYFRHRPSEIAVTDQYTTTATPLPTSELTTISNACILLNPRLVGTTVFGHANGTAGSSLSELNAPWGISINADNSILITELGNLRALRVFPNATIGVKVAPGSSWLSTRKAILDSSLLNLFVLDGYACWMTRYYNGSTVNTVVFGSVCGTNLTQFGGAASFRIDSAGNFYIADNSNHRVILWPVNGTSSSLLAGESGVPGNDSLHLWHPQDIALDETVHLFYVADTFNHRIVRYAFGSLSGTVVAGGNGAGLARNQLNGPCGLYLSTSTNTLYIADTSNHRIVRWYIGDTGGVTIAGDCSGTAGITALLLNTPTTVAMNNDEKYLYVSDKTNNRIQRFTIV